ncbi:MAG: hypothetical protein WDN30_04620 [Pararobbsia sp.]
MSAGLLAAMSLCGSLFVCGAARAADEQVVVDGSERVSDTVRKGGNDVQLLWALEQVVPSKYSVMVPNAGAWADAHVSWHPAIARSCAQRNTVGQSGVAGAHRYRPEHRHRESERSPRSRHGRRAAASRGVRDERRVAHRESEHRHEHEHRHERGEPGHGACRDRR